MNQQTIFCNSWNPNTSGNHDVKWSNLLKILGKVFEDEKTLRFLVEVVDQ